MLQVGLSIRAVCAGVSLVALMAAAWPALCAPVLPAGGVVKAGAATISSPSPSALTITQGSGKASIDWGSFSIGSGGAVRFDNGSGATLNRVTGAGLSSLDGVLSASGSVYLLNPNGVVIGKTGVVDVGGKFIASTLGLSDSQFLGGGDLTFSGASKAIVVNLGRIGSLGGDVALIASTVGNGGEIGAARGDVGLLAGSTVLVRDAALDGGKFAVLAGGAGTSTTNSGSIASAMAELRANGGDVYALAGDTGGVIRATGTATTDGRVFLIADGGTTHVAGTIEAQGVNGTAGSIETSGATLAIGAASVDAHGGTWTLDPTDLTIDQIAAAALSTALNSGTNVTEQTNATGGAGGVGQQNGAGAGDITLSPNVAIAWTTGAGLTLSAYRNVAVGAGATVTSTGGGPVAFYADNAAGGTGTISFGAGAKISTSNIVSLYFNPESNPAGGGVNASSYTNPTDYSPFIGGGGRLAAYMLVNSVADLQDLQNNLNGTYALGRDIYSASASGFNGGAGFAPIGAATTPFTGLLDGRGFYIRDLTVNRPNANAVGLFASLASTATVRNITVSGLNVTGGSQVGGLAGVNAGLITAIRASGSVSGANHVGGLVGDNSGTVSDIELANMVSAVGGGFGDAFGGTVGFNAASGLISRAFDTGIVSGAGSTGGLVGVNAGAIDTSYSDNSVPDTTIVNSVTSNGNTVTTATTYISKLVTTAYGAAGGLVGSNSGTLSNVYATSSASGTDAGGLVGEMRAGSITNAYASGAAAGTSTSGGLIGYAYGGSLTNVYWDATSSTRTDALGAGALAVSSGAPTMIAGATGRDPYSQSAYAAFDFGRTWVMFDGTRPFLRAEYKTSVGNAHDAQLVALDLGATYYLANPVSLIGVTASTGMWNPALGFSPIGSFSAPFVGSFNGYGQSFSDLSISRPSQSGVGLFGAVGAGGVVQNLGLRLPGGSQYSASPQRYIIGRAAVGALVGANAGTLTNDFVDATPTPDFFGRYGPAQSTVKAVGGLGSYVGGLVGDNFATGVISGSKATNLYVSGGYATGGLVGNNAGFIINSSASSPFTSGVNINGNNYQTAVSVFGGGLPYSSVGGLVGQNLPGATIVGSSATAISLATSSIAHANIGGLVGYNGGFVQTSFADAAVATDTSNQSTENDLLGGFVGYNTGYIINSYSLSTLFYRGVLAAGGFVGDNGGIIRDSYATGSSYGFYNSGQSGYLGGFVGYNDTRGVIGTSYSTSQPSSSYSAYFYYAYPGAGVQGGFGGYDAGTISSAYFDVGTSRLSQGVAAGPSAQADASGAVVAIGGSTGRNPRQAATYAGFDFNGPWVIFPGVTRPFLRYNPQSPAPQ